MKKKLALKALQVKSFKTESKELKGGLGLISYGTCIDCITRTCPNPCGSVEQVY